MSFRQLVRRVQRYSGFSERESKEILIMMVEIVASRLDYAERREFAAQLPEQLADIALTVYPALGSKSYDIVAQFMYYQNVGKAHAQRQIQAGWRAIEDALSATEATDIKLQLAARTAYVLG